MWSYFSVPMDGNISQAWLYMNAFHWKMHYYLQIFRMGLMSAFNYYILAVSFIDGENKKVSRISFIGLKGIVDFI